MNIVEYALEQIKDEVLPVDRKPGVEELLIIREIAEKNAQTMPGGLDGNLIFEIVGLAYDFGYWQGWKHCEVERPGFEDFTDDAMTGPEEPTDRQEGRAES